MTVSTKSRSDTTGTSFLMQDSKEALGNEIIIAYMSCYGYP